MEEESYWTNGSWWQSWSHHQEHFTIANMIWLTVEDYMCHKLPWSVSRNRNPVIFSFVAYYRVWNKCSTTSVTNEEETAYISGAPPPVLCRVSVAQSLVFCVVFVDHCFSISLLPIALSVLLSTVSDYSFSSIKPFYPLLWWHPIIK